LYIVLFSSNPSKENHPSTETMPIQASENLNSKNFDLLYRDKKLHYTSYKQIFVFLISQM
jgi:hypothetical protein